MNYESEETDSLDNEVKKQKEKKLTDKLKRDQQIEDIKITLSTESGVRVFQRMMVMARVFETTFTGNSNSFYQEGRRSLALEFLRDLKKASPKKFAEVLCLTEQD